MAVKSNYLLVSNLPSAFLAKTFSILNAVGKNKSRIEMLFFPLKGHYARNGPTREDNQKSLHLFPKNINPSKEPIK
jgi:hypothetical protein